MQTESFRRHADGSIDHDFYRAAAAAERRALVRDVGLALARLWRMRPDGAPLRPAVPAAG